LAKIATYFAHPYNIIRNRIIIGDALIVPANKRVNYTLEDFEAIKDGVWVRDDESNVGLIEGNIAKFG